MAIVLVALFALLLASCGGGGDRDGGNTVTSYTVTANAGSGGSISPVNVTVNSGATTNFTVTPDHDNNINTVTGCSGTLFGNIYTTGAITADCAVMASFVGNALPKINITDASVNEGDSGTTRLSFTVTLSALANGNVDVSYATSNGSATIADSDYIVSSGTLTIPAGSISGTVNIDILGDKYIEGDETLALTLSNPSVNATLGVVAATGTILNEDEPFLNDTGITSCSDGTSNGLACPQAAHPTQDAEVGRDAQAPVKIGGGRAGFDFTKLDSSGNPLADQNEAYSTTSWDCVRDHVTGLMWEIKTTDGGPHDNGHTYTWYNSTGINDGGYSGTENGGICVGSSNCDTEKYVAAINAAGLCGQNDWRLPTVDELSSLVDGSVEIAQNFRTPTIDERYFPNTSPSITWSSSPGSGRSWVVEFQTGIITTRNNFSPYAVRLVRDEQ